MEISVATLEGNRYPVYVEDYYCIEDLKYQIDDATEGRYDPSLMRLIFAGQALEDHQTISECRISGGSTVHMIMKTERSDDPNVPTTGWVPPHYSTVRSTETTPYRPAGEADKMAGLAGTAGVQEDTHGDLNKVNKTMSSEYACCAP